jgi:hypothetical protein
MSCGSANEYMMKLVGDGTNQQITARGGVLYPLSFPQNGGKRKCKGGTRRRKKHSRKSHKKKSHKVIRKRKY